MLLPPEKQRKKTKGNCKEIYIYTHTCTYKRSTSSCQGLWEGRTKYSLLVFVEVGHYWGWDRVD